MNPASIDVKDFLVSQTSYIFGTDLFIGTEPEDPDKCLTLYDHGGGRSDPRFAIEEVAVHFRARSTEYLEAYSMISDLKTLLEGKRSDLTINGSRYFSFTVFTQPRMLMKDTEERFIFTMGMYFKRNPLEKGERI